MWREGGYPSRALVIWALGAAGGEWSFIPPSLQRMGNLPVGNVSGLGLDEMEYWDPGLGVWAHFSGQSWSRSLHSSPNIFCLVDKEQQRRAETEAATFCGGCAQPLTLMPG